MTVGRIVFTLIGCFILAVITGIITRNIFIAVAFPFLLVVFLLMWKNLRKDIHQEEGPGKNVKKDIVEQTQYSPEEQAKEEEELPPVSTNFPSRPY